MKGKSMKPNEMKHLTALLALAVTIAAGAQSDCGLDYDGNGDGAVNIEDVLGVLSEFSEICELPFSCGDSVLFGEYAYQTVQIGAQCWFQENLRTTHYANGDPIPSDLSGSDWVSTSSGAWAVYGEGDSPCFQGCDEEQNLEIHGRLYNGHAVADSRGLCPSGWHVPLDGEWMLLEMFLGMSESDANGISWRGFSQGTKMKSSPTDTPSWNGTNTSGFSSLPSGYRFETGEFFNESGYGYWWSASPFEETFAWFRMLNSANGGVYRSNNSRQLGFSVRCVRDE